MSEITFFYMTNQPTTFANLERDLDPLLSALYTAKSQANLSEAGPDIVRYYKTDSGKPSGEQDVFIMEVGIPVKPGTCPIGEAHVKVLPPYH